MARSHSNSVEQDPAQQARNNIVRQAQEHRRVSFLPVDTSAGADQAETPWDISNIKQMQYWAKQHPNNLFATFNELRQERDAALSCLEEWGDMVDKIDSAQIVALSAQELKREALQKVRQLEADKIRLEHETEELEQKISELRANP